MIRIVDLNTGIEMFKIDPNLISRAIYSPKKQVVCLEYYTEIKGGLSLAFSVDSLGVINHSNDSEEYDFTNIVKVANVKIESKFITSFSLGEVNKRREYLGLDQDLN